MSEHRGEASHIAVGQTAEMRLWRDANLRTLAPLGVIAVAILFARLAGWPATDPRIAGYLPIHSILETACIVVYALVALVSRALIGERRSRNVVLIGAGFLGVAILDLMHMLSFPGMPDVATPSSAGKSISFWLAARLLAAAVLAVAAWSTWNRLADARESRLWLVGSLGLVAAVIWIALFHPSRLPEVYVEGRGQTAVKVTFEMVIAALNVAAAMGFFRLAMKPAATRTYTIEPLALAAAAAVSAIASFLVVAYPAPDSLFNLIAHVYKVFAAGFLYVGIVAVNLDTAQTRTTLALEAADLGLWTWDIPSDRVELDASAGRIWRTTDGRKPTMAALSDLVHPDDRERRLSALRTALDPRGQGTYRCEYRVVKPGQSDTRIVSSSGRTLFRDGQPYRLVGIVRDVTDSRRLDTGIRRSEERLNGIVSIAADAIISMDERHRITLFNHGAETIFGYSREECIGQPLDMLLPERFRPRHAAHIEGFAASSSSARRMAERREIFGLRKNGQEFPAEASISQITIAGERTFTVVLRDNTERRNVERQLALLNQELEARVAERTAALGEETERRLEAQAALSRAQRMEAFGRLAGGVAHDFNNLLTVITGNQELLEMRLQGERELALLKRSQEAAEMGARLTARLLTFARRRQLAPQVLDLNELITSLVELLQRSIGEDITLTTKLAPRLWKVRCDRSEVENALLNLAINARDAMPNGGRLLIETAECTVGPDEVGTETKLQPGDFVRLSVADTGAGMTPDVLARAFEPFFTTKPVGKGTGLGLSTIYGFVQQSGGTVTIHSQQGRGTTINCYLPRAGELTLEPLAAARAVEEPQGRGETVLVVEDNPGVRDVTLQRVASLGYAVLEAETASAAKELIEAGRERIDLVLSDVVMPGGMSGFDLARWIGRRAPAIKVLLSSGYPDQVAAAQASAPGGEGAPDVRMLRKPYARAELAKAIREALDQPALKPS